MAPPFSPTRMIPSQKHIAPVRPIHNSKAVFDDSEIAFTVVGITVTSCRKMTLNKIMIKDITKNKIQIIFKAIWVDLQCTMYDERLINKYIVNR